MTVEVEYWATPANVAMSRAAVEPTLRRLLPEDATDIAWRDDLIGELPGTRLQKRRLRATCSVPAAHA